MLFRSMCHIRIETITKIIENIFSRSFFFCSSDDDTVNLFSWMLYSILGRAAGWLSEKNLPMEARRRISVTLSSLYGWHSSCTLEIFPSFFIILFKVSCMRAVSVSLILPLLMLIIF